MKFLSTVVLLVLCTLTLPARAADDVSPTLAPADLFRVVFPDWHPGAYPHEGDPAPIVVGANVPDVKWPWLPEVAGADSILAQDTSLIEADSLAVVRIDETHAALLARINAYEQVCHYGCIFDIGAYFFTQAQGGWKLTRRVDRVRTVYGEDFSDSEVRDGPGGGKVLATTMIHRAQGLEADQIELIGLGPDRIRFSFETSIAGSSLLEGQEWDVRGKWRVDGTGIVFEFAGDWPDEPADARSRRSPSRKTHARVELKRGVMVPVRGQLPTFSI